MAELNAILEKKLSEDDYELSEKKLLKRIEIKTSELRETQRMDCNNFNSKLTTLKVDLSSATFDTHVHKFLKDQVYTEFSG